MCGMSLQTFYCIGAQFIIVTLPSILPRLCLDQRQALSQIGVTPEARQADRGGGRMSGRLGVSIDIARDDSFIPDFGGRMRHA